MPLSPADRRRGLRRPGLADAGRVPVDRPLDHPALHRQRRRQAGRGGHRRLRAHPQAVRPVDRPLRRRRGSAGAHRRQRLRDQRAVAGDRGRGRPRREAGGAVDDRQVPLHRDGAAKSPRDAMDIHGGKGIILGPRNYLGRGWQAAPISITVEGANIMTRSLMIFGQGAIRCHPWVLKEMQAAQHPGSGRAPARVRHATCSATSASRISNAVRSWWYGLTGAEIGAAPGDAYTRRYYRKLNRYSANLALMADTSMLLLGGKLKFKEKLSGPPRRRAQPAVHRQRDAQALRGRGPPGDRPAAARVGVPRRGAQDRDWRCRARCATSRSARSAGCCGCWCSRGAAARRRRATAWATAPRAADVAVRSARPPRPTACS